MLMKIKFSQWWSTTPT